jgi:hypothetical protein
MICKSVWIEEITSTNYASGQLEACGFVTSKSAEYEMHLINQLEVQDVAFYQMHLQMTIMRV